MHVYMQKPYVKITKEAEPPTLTTIYIYVYMISLKVSLRYHGHKPEKDKDPGAAVRQNGGCNWQPTLRFKIHPVAIRLTDRCLNPDIQHLIPLLLLTWVSQYVW